MEEKNFNQSEVIKELEAEEVAAEKAEKQEEALDIADTDKALDRNVRLMSPTRMLLRRFFRSRRCSYSAG